MGSVSNSRVEKCETTIIKKTGKAFFDRHISFNQSASAYYQVTGTTNLVFDFKFDGKPWIKEQIHFLMDAKGNFTEIRGIPNCADGCTYEVDEERAKAIAREAGIQGGLITDFHFADLEDGEEKVYVGYVWSVKNDQNPGKEILINPHTEEVVWEVEFYMAE